MTPHLMFTCSGHKQSSKAVRSRTKAQEKSTAMRTCMTPKQIMPLTSPMPGAALRWRLSRASPGHSAALSSLERWRGTHLAGERTLANSSASRRRCGLPDEAYDSLALQACLSRPPLITNNPFNYIGQADSWHSVVAELALLMARHRHLLAIDHNGLLAIDQLVFLGGEAG